MSTAHQVSDWAGRTGEVWTANQARLDAMLAPFGEAAIDAAAPQPGERVIDVGCGAGATSLALAQAVGPAGRVVGLDISEALIARARQLAPKGAPVEFVVGDAAATPLAVGGFDLLFSRFGVMFFDDPVGAFAHLRGALRPGGRLVFVCWRDPSENDMARLILGAVSEVIPPPPPPDPELPGPFAFADPARVRAILREAGFADVTLTPVDDQVPFGRGDTPDAALDDAVDMAFEVGPLSRLLADQPEALRDEVARAVRAAFQPKLSRGSVRLAAAGWIVTAKRGA